MPAEQLTNISCWLFLIDQKLKFLVNISRKRVHFYQNNYKSTKITIKFCQLICKFIRDSTPSLTLFYRSAQEKKSIV